MKWKMGVGGVERKVEEVYGWVYKCGDFASIEAIAEASYLLSNSYSFGWV